SRRSQKIFMGDTGSMILGFLLVFTAIKFVDVFIERDVLGVPGYHLPSAPVVAVAILILPIVDTLNVIIIRLLNKKSPMEADKNHIHHRVLELGLSHRGATFSIITYYLFVVLVTYFLRHIDINLLLVIVLVLGFIGAYIPVVILKFRNKGNKKELYN
ncbi:MAG: MraY family glycosyltransferase, partial [Bergeyella zoohelcum]|nr:MraY family glycosyltransferase [Bergeyella zoohelcum]